MLGTIYALCAFTAFLCACLLLRAYSQSKYRFLLWGGLCFAGLTISNILLVFDKLIFPSVDLSTIRVTVTLASMLILLYGLIWDTD